MYAPIALQYSLLQLLLRMLIIVGIMLNRRRLWRPLWRALSILCGVVLVELMLDTLPTFRRGIFLATAPAATPRPSDYNDSLVAGIILMRIMRL